MPRLSLTPFTCVSPHGDVSNGPLFPLSLTPTRALPIYTAAGSMPSAAAPWHHIAPSLDSLPGSHVRVEKTTGARESASGHGERERGREREREGGSCLTRGDRGTERINAVYKSLLARIKRPSSENRTRRGGRNVASKRD